MSVSVRYKENTVEHTDELFVYCDSCNKKTFHKVLTSQEEMIEEDYGSDYSGLIVINEYQVIRCCGCRFMHFLKLTRGNEYFDNDGYYTEEIVYPPEPVSKVDSREMNVRVSSINQHISKNVLIPYSETLNALNSNCLVLCSIGLRACLEQIILHKLVKLIIIGIKKLDLKYPGLKSDFKEIIEQLSQSYNFEKFKTLNSKISNTDYEELNKFRKMIEETLDKRIQFLHDNGYINEKENSHFDGIKYIGNDGAHKVLINVTKETLNDALDYLELVIISEFEPLMKLHDKQVM